MFVSATLLTLGVIQAVEVEPSTNNTLAVTGARAGLQADLRYGARVPLFERDGQALFEGTGLKAQDIDLIGVTTHPSLIKLTTT